MALLLLLVLQDFDLERLKPFWSSTRMDGESVLFVKEGGRATAPLLMTPVKILGVRGAMRYEEGKDWTWSSGSRDLVLPEGSRIPCVAPSDLRRPAGTQRFQLKHRDGGDEIRFGATREYHDLQVEVTYERAPDAWKGPSPESPGDRLSRTSSRLAAKQALKIGLIGDSISTGCNASGWAKAPPFQPPWEDLFRRAIESRSGSKVALDNHAVGGTASAWGLEKMGALLAGEPDLVLIAFGMNDAGGTTADAYRANVGAMLEAVKKARPGADVILVSPMRANPDWTALKHERFAEYREALLALRGPGVEVADLTSIWTEFLRLKRDADLTGNGVNHPNDFGHRVYAQVLLSRLYPN